MRQTQFGLFGIKIRVPKFIKNAVKTAGRGIHSATKAVSKGASTIGKGLSKIPVVGPGVHGAFDITVGGPLKLANSIASGDRIDRAAMNHLKSTVRSAREVAPYVQTVVSVVPGVGTGVSGVIGGSLALAEGRNITDAVTKGIADGLPGGPLVKAAGKVGYGIMRGKSVDKIALDALPLSPQSKRALATGVQVTRQLASGKRVDHALVDATYENLPDDVKKTINVSRGKGGNVAELVANASMNLLPEEERKGLVIGMAVGNARKLQRGIKQEANSPATHEKIANFGKVIAKTNAVIKSGRVLSGANHHGYDMGIGLMGHANVSQKVLLSIRKSLSGGDRRGFDMALAVHIGLVTRKAPVSMTPMEKAGFYITNGMMGGTENQKTSMMKTVAENKDARGGAKVAIVDIANARSSLWTKIKKILGIAVDDK